jgi:hypothetical protein
MISLNWCHTCKCIILKYLYLSAAAFKSEAFQIKVEQQGYKHFQCELTIASSNIRVDICSTWYHINGE